MLSEQRKYVCPYCGMKNPNKDKCDGCWSVESYIQGYLKSKKGIKNIKKYVKEAEKNLKNKKEVL